jgi:hypothetical protein
MGGTCGMNVEKRNACRLFIGKQEGKRPLGRPRCRWMDNIKMDLGEIGWWVIDWNGLVQDRDKCCNEPSDSIKW